MRLYGATRRDGKKCFASEIFGSGRWPMEARKMTGPDALRGEIWEINLDPVIGHEQAGARPALIVSVDLFNEGPAELIVVAPISRTARKVRWHVPVSPRRVVW